MIDETSEQMAARVCAVVVNLDAGNLLTRCLGSIRSEGVATTVVVDNASTDGSLNAVTDELLLVNAENAGFARAVNVGASAIEPREFLLLLNPDAWLEPGSLRALVGALDAAPDAVAAGPRIVDKHGRTVVSARRFPGPSMDVLESMRLTRLLPEAVRRKKVQGSLVRTEGPPSRVDWVSGACMLIRRGMWDALEGFSEEFFVYGEELDLCWRASRRGWRCLYVPEAVAGHVGGVSAATVTTQEGSRARIQEAVRLASRRNMHPLSYRAWSGTQRLVKRVR